VSAQKGELTVTSVTGVDVALPVAGPGARAYAFLIDWHVRLVLGLGWYVGAALLYNRALSLTPPSLLDPRWFGAVLAPAAALYLLYHYVLEIALHGRTPGKRMAGVRIAAQDGSVPSAGALLVRNVFRLLDSLPLCYAVGLIATIATHEHRRIGDLAAGTLLVYERDETRAALPSAGSRKQLRDPVSVELVAELLERWSEIEPAARRALARQLLERHGDAVAPGVDEQALHERLLILLRDSTGTAT
jgi:uncharacterized RDD family membrane protein YckC